MHGDAIISTGNVPFDRMLSWTPVMLNLYRSSAPEHAAECWLRLLACERSRACAEVGTAEPTAEPTARPTAPSTHIPSYRPSTSPTTLPTMLPSTGIPLAPVGAPSPAPDFDLCEPFMKCDEYYSSQYYSPSCESLCASESTTGKPTLRPSKPPAYFPSPLVWTTKPTPAPTSTAVPAACAVLSGLRIELSIGHNYLSHNYIGHYYIGHNYIGAVWPDNRALDLEPPHRGWRLRPRRSTANRDREVHAYAARPSAVFLNISEHADGERRGSVPI